jgi:hypothetical protein
MHGAREAERALICDWDFRHFQSFGYLMVFSGVDSHSLAECGGPLAL